MHSDTPAGQKARSNLEERWSGKTTSITDEVYFFGASDFGLFSENLCIAHQTEQPGSIFGDMNVIFAGDPAQLPPPHASALYDWTLVNCYSTQSLNALNENTKHDVEGISAWHQVDKCVMLTKIMWQKDKSFQDVLCHLQFGNFSENDFLYLQPFIVANRAIEVNQKLLSLENWIKDPDTASPLICYTNAVRDAHNMKASESFAKMTGQDFHIYYSTDSHGKGKKQVYTSE